MSREPVTRRRLLAGALGFGAVGALAAAGCSAQQQPPPLGAAPTSALPRGAGNPRVFTLTARPVQVDLAGKVVKTWAYDGVVPGPTLRMTVGESVRIRVRNELPEPTSVHWHGLTVPNAMDGVPGVTTPGIEPGTHFDYEFVVPDSGTHWFHPHTGLQLDRGLYAPLIVDDRNEPGDYDAEWIVVLDDWLDGVRGTPDQAYADLVAGTQGGDEHVMPGMGSGDMPMDHGAMNHGGMGDMGGAEGMPGMGGMGHGAMDQAGDVSYPLYLINGRAPGDPDVLRARPGDRVRVRMINAAADTIFTVAIGDHRMTVTHTDGFAVQPVRGSAVLLGMGERLDAVVTVGDGAFPLVAQAAGRAGAALAVVRTSPKSPSPTLDRLPPELQGPVVEAASLRAGTGTELAAREPDVVHDVVLTGSMAPYRWAINGQTDHDAAPLTVADGQLARLRFANMSMMSHPMHLHGHTFQLGAAGGGGPRKDTVLIPPMGSVVADVDARNPGKWMLHCHNAYHAEAGMMTRFDYAGQ